MERKQVILVTGSSGLIGAATVARTSRAFQVIGFDKIGPPHPPPQAECVTVDLTSDESLELGLERVRYAYGDRLVSVVHLAAYYDFSGQESPLYEELTVRGTERLLRGLREFKVDQFVFSSTMLVHAPTQAGRPISEDSPLGATWDYPQSKVDAEGKILEEHGEMRVVVLRIAGVYDDQCHSIPLAHQIQRIYERRITSKTYPGDLSHGQAFVHLDDVVEAIRLAVERRHELPSETVLLIGESQTFSYDTLQRTLGRLIHGEEWETHQIPKTLAEAGAWLRDIMPFGEDPFIKPWMIERADDHYELDVSRAEALLGWAPRHSLMKTLPKMIEALKNDPATFYRTNHLQGEPSPASAVANPVEDAAALPGAVS